MLKSMLPGIVVTGMFLGMTGSTLQAADKEKKTKPVLRHVVLFQFKESATDTEIKEIEKAFAALPKKIDVIIDYEWGRNNSPEGLDDGFTHCFIVTFADTRGRDIYLPHPSHKEFIALLKPKLERALVVDFFAKDNSCE